MRCDHALAALGAFGLALAGVPASAGAGPVLTVRLCGGGMVRVPLGPRDGKGGDCPSPCHATCPRKHTGLSQEEGDTC